MTRPTGEDAMSSEHVEVLLQMKGRVGVDCRGVFLPTGRTSPEQTANVDAALDAAIASLSAPQPPAEAQPVAWLGANPRTGVPVMAVRTPAPSVMRDFAMRPLYAHPPPSAPVVDRARTLDAARFRAACYALKEKVEGAGCERWEAPDGTRLKDTPEWVAFYNHVSNMRERGGPPPSAPVGVEGRAREAVALALDEAGHHTEANNVRRGIDLDEYRVELSAARIALAQQPAAVDEAMVERAWEAAMEIKHNKESWFPMTKRRMKRALTAALAGQQGGDNA